MQSQEVELIVSKFATHLEKLNISTSEELKPIKQFKLIGEIEKLIQQTTNTKKKLSKLDVSEKIGEIRKIILIVLNDERVKKLLTEKQINSIKSAMDEAETVETIVDMIEFIYDNTKDKVLEGLDANKDGKVTTDEVKTKCGCCGNNKLATCWSKFLINFICCGKNDESTYEKQKEGIEV